jgi:hypothetical protein
MQNSGQTTVVLFGNALDPRGRTNHPQPASPRPHESRWHQFWQKINQYGVLALH